MTENPILWKANNERRSKSAMQSFMRLHGFEDYQDLYQWSVRESAAFWESLCEFCDVRFSKTPRHTLLRPHSIMDPGWFDGGELNYAEHLLRHTGDRAALVFCAESGERREISFDDLRTTVAAVAEGLRQIGVEKGDRVAGYLPNCPEAMIAMLAATSRGAIWSSCSPDFGVNGVADRFGQIEPKVLFGPNGYRYNGKLIDSLPTLAGIVDALPSVECCVVVNFIENHAGTTDVPKAIAWDDFQVAGVPLSFSAVEFGHPLFIMYSSGTTGAPKCIVHAHGGTLLQHLKEHVLHCDLGVDDRLFYFTTCGWMMWNWLVSGLASGATLVLYDGSPFFADGRVLWEMAQRENVTVFGTSAKYISALQKAGVRPVDEYQFPALRTVLSTGSPLAPESFDFVYDAIGSDLQLSSIAGGTDILSCFVLGNPTLPVRRGEIQCRGLGMAVQIFDDSGRPVTGQHGELVCTQPFPSSPAGFWNDANNERYRSAYFDRFADVWAQGDFAELTDNGGVIIYGRSDAVLNPGGVRIGTAEIYRQVEKLDEVIESIAIGQNWHDDVRVVLFVVLLDGTELDDALGTKIRRVIREQTTPRHVPAKIVAVAEIPRTKSGKIVELAVRSVVHGESVKNTEALANPQALEHFHGLAVLQED